MMWLHRFADQVTQRQNQRLRAEQIRLRAELRTVRRCVKDMRHAHHTLTQVAAIRSVLLAELRDELAAVKAQQGENQ